MCGSHSKPVFNGVCGDAPVLILDQWVWDVLMWSVMWKHHERVSCSQLTSSSVTPLLFITGCRFDMIMNMDESAGSAPQLKHTEYFQHVRTRLMQIISSFCSVWNIQRTSGSQGESLIHPKSKITKSQNGFLQNLNIQYLFECVIKGLSETETSCPTHQLLHPAKKSHHGRLNMFLYQNKSNDLKMIMTSDGTMSNWSVKMIRMRYS